MGVASGRRRAPRLSPKRKWAWWGRVHRGALPQSEAASAVPGVGVYETGIACVLSLSRFPRRAAMVSG